MEADTLPGGLQPTLVAVIAVGLALLTCSLCWCLLTRRRRKPSAGSLPDADSVDLLSPEEVDRRKAADPKNKTGKKR